MSKSLLSESVSCTGALVSRHVEKKLRHQSIACRIVAQKKRSLHLRALFRPQISDICSFHRNEHGSNRIGKGKDKTGKSFSNLASDRPSDATTTREQHALMAEKTRKLLRAKLSVDDAEVWNDAEQVLTYWCKQRPRHGNNQSNNDPRSGADDHDPVTLCIRLLDRLSGIMPQNETLFGAMLGTEILNRILFQWKTSILTKQRQGKNQRSVARSHRHSRGQPPQRLTPSAMTEKIEKYRWSSLVQPNAHTYHLILESASSYKTEADGVQFAEALLERLIGVSEASPSASLVDAVSFGYLIGACIQQRLPQKGEEWLRRMQEIYRNHRQYGGNDDDWQAKLQPNFVVYTHVINGWARVGNGPRAQAILEEQIEDCLENKNSAAQPDIFTFNAVLDAWAKTKRTRGQRGSEVTRHTQTILNQMQEFSSTHDWKCTPDSYTFASMIACSAAHEGPEKAEQLLQELERIAATDDGKTRAKLTVVQYNTVLNAYARAGKAQQAQALLQTLLQQASSPFSSPTTVQPDEISFNSVITAWSKSKDAEAPLRAQALLAIMEDLSIQPTVYTYGSLINCWANSNRTGAAEKAEELLREMQGTPNLKPNTICYNSVLKAWSNEARKTRGAEPLARLTTVFKELHQQGRVKPDGITFRIMLHAVAASSVQNKMERAQMVVTLMERFGIKPDSSDRSLLKRLSNQNEKKKTRTME